MNRKIMGIIKCGIILVIDAGLLFYFINDYLISSIILGLIILYAFFFGELFATMGAIRLDKLNYSYQSKLAGSVELMLDQYEYIYGKRKNIKVYLIPDDSQFNAYAFGLRKIGITSEALNLMDRYSVAAVLSHEMGHIENFDVCIKRLLIVNMLGTLTILGIMQMIWGVVIFIIYMILIWILNSFIGVYIGSGIFKVLTTIGKGIIHIFLVLMQSIIAFVERGSEYKADEFACVLGYGAQLAMILERYIGEIPPAQSLSDIIYATHPKTVKRVARIEKKMQKEMVTCLRLERNKVK